MSKIAMKPQDILPPFDEFLSTHQKSFEAIVIGGGALCIMGVIPRMTADFDILDPEIPTDIIELAKKFRDELKLKGINIDSDWLNNGPESLKQHLPKGWRGRTVNIFSGKAVVFHTLGRLDFIMTKLDACCTRVQPDLDDLINLKPTRDELISAKSWVLGQDASPQWPEIVEKATRHIAKKLGYEL